MLLIVIPPINLKRIVLLHFLLNWALRDYMNWTLCINSYKRVDPQIHIFLGVTYANFFHEFNCEAMLFVILVIFSAS